MTDQTPNSRPRKSSEGPTEGGTPEDILEEITGFNLRSFRTLRDLFLKPSKVFEAYARGERTYTPSLRLWLSFTVMLTVITYFFGSHEDLFANAYANWPESLREQVLLQINGSLEDLARVQGDLYGLLHSTVSGLVGFTSIGLIALFSGPLRWAARLNLTFALTSAGAATSLVLFPIMVQRPDLGLVMVPIMLAVYSLTYARGAPGLGADASKRRWLKAGAIGLYSAFVSLGTGVGLYFVSLSYAVETLS